jgi:C4-dicarboxylate-specific signal transduction histidine kinase
MRVCLNAAMVVLLATSIHTTSTPLRKQTGRSHQSHPADAKQAVPQEQSGTERQPLVVKVVPTPQSQEEIAQEDEQRKEKTANDKKLVEFTWELVVATGILAGIGTLQLFVFGLQSFYLRKTVAAASEQSEAMERAIIEASRSAAAMEEVAKHIETSAKTAGEQSRSMQQSVAEAGRLASAMEVVATEIGRSAKAASIVWKPSKIARQGRCEHISR